MADGMICELISLHGYRTPLQKQSLTRMIRPLLFLLFGLSVGPLLRAEPNNSTTDSELASTLNFEREQTGTSPAGWHGGPPGTLFIDGNVVHTGKWAARIERTPSSPQTFSTLTKSWPMTFKGHRIELRGFLRTDQINGFAGLWLREDGSEGSLEFANMQERELAGTTGWKEYSVSLPLNPNGRKLFFGVLLAGTGKVWADDLRLLVDDKPVWEAPKVGVIQTILDRDTEFIGGSKIDLATLTPVQITNLATLCKVWGLLKYYHPKITSGQAQWDYELFRVLPAVLAAKDQAGANQTLVQWIDHWGDLKPAIHAKLGESNLYLRPDLSWTEDVTALGKELCERLEAVQAAHSSNDDQFYVSLDPGACNPVFDHEMSYPDIRLPDSGFQLLSLFRYWNMIRYWSPYRDLVEENWDKTLSEFIPRIAQARSADAYELELMALIAKVHDTHANLWSSLQVRPPVGNGKLPIIVRFIEGHPTVTELTSPAAVPSAGLMKGDLIRAIDGIPIEDLIRTWAPYYAASNEPTRNRDIAQQIDRGPAGPVKILIKRGKDALEINALRVRISSLPQSPTQRWHDLPGPTFRLLSKEVAYLKLSSVKAADAVSYVQQAAGTKGWIIDARGYPAEFVVFALGGHLVEKPVPFVQFTYGDLSYPGAFSFRYSVSLKPLVPHYSGKVVILVDEATQSQGEYTAMALRAAPGTMVIGSTTAGADGNVSQIPLPGGLHTMMSGIGVFYPDRRPTQRVGIIPDIEVSPTLAGITSSRDEVLEAGLRQILGPKISADEIRKLTAISSE